MDIAIDFDGTVVAHEYPNVGKDIGAVTVLRKIIESGNNIILYTMRSGKHLQDAIDWYAEKGIPLYGVQFHPTQKTWTDSNKCYAQLYIDDAALGCPLVIGDHSRPYVYWAEVEQILLAKGIILDIQDQRFKNNNNAQ
jgi:hypothetical protein